MGASPESTANDWPLYNHERWLSGKDTRLYALNWDAFVPAVTGYAPSRRAADAVIGTRLGPAHAGFVPA